MSENKDYYKILGLEKGASKDDLAKAYKKLARKVCFFLKNSSIILMFAKKMGLKKNSRK
jgi:preprotein translocase subunit Sec63